MFLNSLPVQQRAAHCRMHRYLARWSPPAAAPCEPAAPGQLEGLATSSNYRPTKSDQEQWGSCSRLAGCCWGRSSFPWVLVCPLVSHHPWSDLTPLTPLTFCPAYSPWIPIIVSRIKTLSAKIFSASRIWCMPSPCGDRYSHQVTWAAARPSATMQRRSSRLVIQY